MPSTSPGGIWCPHTPPMSNSARHPRMTRRPTSLVRPESAPAVRSHGHHNLSDVDRTSLRIRILAVARHGGRRARNNCLRLGKLGAGKTKSYRTRAMWRRMLGGDCAGAGGESEDAQSQVREEGTSAEPLLSRLDNAHGQVKVKSMSIGSSKQRG